MLAFHAAGRLAPIDQMDRPASETVERLGAAGMTRVLEDLLDQSRLVRLAASVGLKYPGMRTQSQTRQRLIADLLDRAAKSADARKSLLRALRKETIKPTREWAALPAEEKARRLQDEPFLLTGGNLGLHLYLLAGTADSPELEHLGIPAMRERLARLAANGRGPETAAPERVREQGRLSKKLSALEKKVHHLETQLGKARETERSLKRDLIQRKGELAESRMLVERLRAELAQASARVASSDAPSAVPADPSLQSLVQAVRRLATDQRKLAAQLNNRRESAPARPAAETDGLAPLLESVRELQKELAGLRRERKKQDESQVQRLEELRALLRSQREQPAAPAKTGRSRARGDRVGVFVDVQNVYYSARQLEGKLDFDALLQAAVQDRRLIQATAYVVESKEIDQSQFIARLQKRGIDVRRKTLQVRADGSMKGDWDMELALDILEAAPRLDVVVLVSGDGDFTSLVKRVKSMGPRVEVLAFPQNTAKSLLEAADQFQPLDRKFMIPARTAKAPARKRQLEPAAAAPVAEGSRDAPQAKSTPSAD